MHKEYLMNTLLSSMLVLYFPTLCRSTEIIFYLITNAPSDLGKWPVQSHSPAELKETDVY